MARARGMLARIRALGLNFVILEKSFYSSKN